MSVRRPRTSGQRGISVRARVVTAVTIVLVALTLRAADTRMRPVIEAIGEARARVVAMGALTEGLASVASMDVPYDALMTIRTDNEGKVALVQPNTPAINKVAANAARAVQRSLNALRDQRFTVPLGEVLGSHLFANWGPALAVSVAPVGAARVEVLDDFAQAGINQTRHRVYLKVTSIVRVVAPLARSSVVVSTSVPVAEAVIMGDVPQVYMGSDLSHAATSHGS